MKKIFLIFSFLPLFSSALPQNVGIGTNSPAGKLQVNHRSTPQTPGVLLVDSNQFQSGLIRFRNINSPKFIEAWGYSGSPVSSAEQYLDIWSDSLFIATFRGNGRVGINQLTPSERLDVNGNINLTGMIKANGVSGQPNQVLGTNETGNLAWTDRAQGTAGGNVGFGFWGDCSMNNVTEYCPVSDSATFGDYFGHTVSMSGDYAIVGSYGDDGSAGINQGSATVYRFNGTKWVFMQKIFDPTGAANDYFGVSVSMSGNYAIVGAYLDDGAAGIDQGSASIYEFNGSSWVFMQKITDATGAASDGFGLAVALSGNYAIIGAPSDDSGPYTNNGSASIYQFNGSSWVLMQKITDVSGNTSDEFGYSVSISANRAIVGAHLDDITSLTDSGSASIYQFNGTSWALMEKITRAGGIQNNGDHFGKSVAISGNYVVVGSPEAGTARGDVMIFLYDAGNWDRFLTLYDDNPASFDSFGNAVSIAGDYLIVGEFNDNLGAGAACIFKKLGMGWQKYQFIKDPGGSNADFGSSVCIDETSKRFMIGAPNFPVLNQIGKVVFGKVN